MTKRRRGGGEAGETDIVDAQLLERDAAEDLAFLRSPIPACPLAHPPAAAFTTGGGGGRAGGPPCRSLAP